VYSYEHFPSLSSDVSNHIVAVCILQVDEVEAQWHVSRWHCLNEISWLLLHQFSIIILDMDESEIMGDIRGNLDSLWLVILLEVIINVVVISCLQEFVVQWNLSEGSVCLTSIDRLSLNKG